MVVAKLVAVPLTRLAPLVVMGIKDTNATDALDTDVANVGVGVIVGGDNEVAFVVVAFEDALTACIRGRNSRVKQIRTLEQG